jgi:hypothetical protein
MGTALLLKPLYRFSAATSAGTAGQALLGVSAFQVKAGEMERMDQGAVVDG